MRESKENADETIGIVSKSQRRRDALETRSLARELIAMKPSELAQLPLDEALRLAIEEARRIRSHVAHKRQLQFVAKLLRRTDPEPITRAMAAAGEQARQLNARQHRVEGWRDHLLAVGDPAVGELARLRRDTDIQAIRQLLRRARQEAARDKPPAAARSLFRLLREMDEREGLPLRAGSGEP